MSKYLLQKSDTRQYGWVLTDTENQIVCQFDEGAYNDSQKFTPLKDASEYDVTKLPSMLNGMSDWLRENHYEIVFTSPQRIHEEARASIGEQLREAREAKGWSTRNLAKLTGIAQNHISRIEQGRYNVNIDTVAMLAEVLDVDIII